MSDYVLKPCIGTTQVEYGTTYYNKMMQVGEEVRSTIVYFNDGVIGKVGQRVVDYQHVRQVVWLVVSVACQVYRQWISNA